MGCAASRTGENGDEDDGDDDFFDDYGEEEEEDDLDDLRSQPGDTPLLAIDRLALDEEAGTGPQQQQQRYQAAPPVQPTTVPAPLAVTASTDDTLVALATSMGSSRRRWDDEEAVAEQSTVAAPPRPLAQDPAALPDTLPAKKMVFMTAGSAFKHRSAEYSSSLTPTVPALVDATQPTALNPLAAPLPVDQRRSSSTGKPRSRPSNMTMDEVAMSPPIPLDWDAPECLSVDMLLRRATQEQRGYWKNQPAVPPPVMGRLTHPGLKGVEQWLAETGATPQAVPSLVSSPLGSDQLLNRRALNSNDRIIRSIVERRRASVSSAQSDDDDDNARRRSSSRFRKVPMEATVDDGGIMSELAALQDQIDAADDDEGDNSSKHTVRSEDGVLSIRPSSRMSGHHPAPRLSPAQRVNSRA